METTEPKKLGGKRPKLLGPFADEIVTAYRKGESFQAIADWLAMPPRNVVTSRQAVQRWLKARIARIESRSESIAILELGKWEPTSQSSAGRAVSARQSITSSNPAPATAPSSDPAVSVAADGMPRINVRPTSAAFVPPTEGAADAGPEETSGKRSDRHKPAKLF